MPDNPIVTPPATSNPNPAAGNKDYVAINTVIAFLGFFALLGLFFVFALLFWREKDKLGEGMTALIALIGSAVGALSSILAQTSTSRGPVPTTVVNRPDEPVPVEEKQTPSDTVTVSGPNSVTQGQTANYQAMAGGKPSAAQWKVDTGQIQVDPNDASKAVFTAPTTTATVTITAIKTDDATKRGQIQVQVP